MTGLDETAPDSGPDDSSPNDEDARHGRNRVTESAQTGAVGCSSPERPRFPRACRRWGSA